MTFLQSYKRYMVPMYERGDTFIPNPYKYTESHFVEWIDELQSVKEEPLARFLIKQLNYYIEQKKIGAFK